MGYNITNHEFMTDLNIGWLKHRIEEAKRVMILLPEWGDLDEISAGLTLGLALQKKGIKVTILHPKEMTAKFNRLIGIDQVKHSLVKNNLFLDLNYRADWVEKVDTQVNTESGSLELAVLPTEGKPAPDYHLFEFKYKGIDADVVFWMGVTGWSDLGHFEKELKGEIVDEEIVQISNRQVDSPIQEKAFIWPTSSSLCEIVYRLLDEMGMELDEDIATNLLIGIDVKTNYLRSLNITAESLEAAAGLLRRGAVRGYIEADSNLGEETVVDSNQNEKNEGLSSVPIVSETVGDDVGVEESTLPSQNVDEKIRSHKNDDIDMSNHEQLPNWMTPKIFAGTH